MGQILSYCFGYCSLSFGQWNTGFYTRNVHKLKRVEEDLEVIEAVNFANQSLKVLTHRLIYTVYKHLLFLLPSPTRTF